MKVEKNSKEIETEIAENCLVYYIASCPPISRQLPPRGGRTTYGEGLGRGWQRTDKGKKKIRIEDIVQDAAGKFGKSDVTIRRAWQRFEESVAMDALEWPRRAASELLGLRVGRSLRHHFREVTIILDYAAAQAGRTVARPA